MKPSQKIAYKTHNGVQLVVVPVTNAQGRALIHVSRDGVAFIFSDDAAERIATYLPYADDSCPVMLAVQIDDELRASGDLVESPDGVWMTAAELDALELEYRWQREHEAGYKVVTL